MISVNAGQDLEFVAGIFPNGRIEARLIIEDYDPSSPAPFAAQLHGSLCGSVRTLAEAVIGAANDDPNVA